MAGALIKLDEEIVSAAVASVSLGATNWSTAYDVYMVKVSNAVPVSANQPLFQRFLVSGSPDTTANYDTASKRLRSDTTFSNYSATNQTQLHTVVANASETGTVPLNFIQYLFNFNNASEYSFTTIESSGWYASTTNALHGAQGGAVLTVSQACNGVQYYFNSGNIAQGNFTLYGLIK